jgi:hypothetical protein
MDVRVVLFLSCIGPSITLLGCKTEEESPPQLLSTYPTYHQLRKENLLFPEEEALLTSEAAKRANEQLARGVFFPLQIKPNEQLQMVVSLNNAKMVTGQPLEMQVSLSNVSSSTLYVNAAPQPFYQTISPFQCRIFDANGKFYWGFNALVQGMSVSDLQVIELEPYGSVNLALYSHLPMTPGGPTIVFRVKKTQRSPIRGPASWPLTPFDLRSVINRVKSRYTLPAEQTTKKLLASRATIA